MHIYDPNRREANPLNSHLPELAELAEKDISADALDDGLFRLVGEGWRISFGPDDEDNLDWAATLYERDEAVVTSYGSRGAVLADVIGWVERRK